MTLKEAESEPVNARAGGSLLPMKQVEAALARIDFGTIQLTVHNGRLVQIDVTERQRFPA